MSNKLNIDRILQELEQVKTAEDAFAASLQTVPVEVVAPVEEPVVIPPVEEVITPVEEVLVPEEVTSTTEPEVVSETLVQESTPPVEEEKTAELEKVAAEWDAKGRIMARAFFDEIEKIANAQEPEKIASEEPIVPENLTGKDLIMDQLTKFYF